MIRLAHFLTLAAGMLTLSASTTLSAAEPPEARFYPPTTVLYAEMPDPAALASTLVEHPLRAEIEALPAFANVIQTPPWHRLEMGRAFLEGHFGMAWTAALDDYAKRGVCIGVDPASKGFALLVRGKDSAAMEHLQERLVALLGRRGLPPKTAEYRGHTAYDSGQLKWAIHEDRLLLTNQDALGRQMLDRLIDERGDSLADQQDFQTATAARRPATTAWAYVDIAELRQLQRAQPLYTGQLPDPFAELIFGGIQSVLGETPYAAAELNVTGDRLGLRITTPFSSDWIPEWREYYWGPEGSGRGPAVPELEQTLLTLSTYRNLSEMWLWAGDLFDEQTNDKIAKADANLTTLFAGRDFGEDILAAIEPELCVVATRQDFANTMPLPTLRLPAFGVSLGLRDPQIMRGELRRIFESLIGFLNVVGAMQGRHQLELDRQPLGQDGEVVSATFVPEVDEQDSLQASIVFNFSPSLAFAGDRFVIASTKQLAQRLITAEVTKPATIAANTAATLHLDVLSQILADNREQLIAQNMLSQGNRREDAEQFVDLLLTATQHIELVSLRLGPDDQQLQLDAELRLAP